MTREIRRALAAGALLAVALAAGAGTLHDHHPAGQDMHRHDPGSPAARIEDARTPVAYPPALRIHTLANMRDHLLALQQIQDALGRGDYEAAGDIAEQRLGMSSLALHGAHDVAPHMPQGMQAIGTEMHRAASRFAVAASDAGVTGEVRPALTALAGVTSQCVACHAGYRLE